MANPMYGQNNNDKALNAVSQWASPGYNEITVATAADASHTLTAADAGITLISAALADGAVIKLPEANADTIGLKFRLVYAATMAVASTIKLPNAGKAVFAGVVEANRCGNAAGVTDAEAVNRTTIVCTKAQAEKVIALDENDETFGGGIGTDLEFFYASEDVVFVSGHINVNKANTAIDALQATSFTGTGY